MSFGVFSFHTRDAEDQKTGSGEGFITEEVNGVENKGKGNITTVDVESFMEAFLEDFWSWNCFPQLLKYQNFWNISIFVKGIVLQFIVAS